MQVMLRYKKQINTDAQTELYKPYVFYCYIIAGSCGTIAVSVI